uniref:sirohydrochlorin chelatase n=1 Tax=Nocardioides stalactiti TaxID=2755356 RepID=UPI0015FED4B3
MSATPRRSSSPPPPSPEERRRGEPGKALLVTVAHGTRKTEGNRVAVELTVEAGRRLGLPSIASYVELCEPLFADVVAGLRQPAIVVPLLLSTGFHVRHDLPAAVADAGAPVVLGDPLGPDPLLAAAQVDRLVEAGAVPGQPIVMVAAGSNDPAASAGLI